MNLKNVEKKEHNTADLTIEISGAEFQDAVDKVYRKVKGQITLPGFRKGKAPRKLVEKMYGADVFYEDALEELSPAIMEEIGKQEDLELVGYPKTDVKSMGPEGAELVITVGLMPVAKLGQYKEIPAPRQEVSVSEEEVETALKPYISRATAQVSVDRPIQEGDTAVIDFEGFVDGVAFEGGKGENHELKIGSGTFIPGFEEQLVGVSAGEEKDVNVTFPEQYHAADLAGKEAVFHCKVHEVKEEQVPELDDEFAKDVSEFETFEELRADLKAKALERKEKEAENAFHQAVLTAAINNAEMDIPETMVEYETDRMMENYESRLQGAGITFDQYLNMMGTNRTEFRRNVRADALRQIQVDLLLRAVADAEGLEATEEEVEAHVKELSEQYGMEADKIKAAIDAETLARDVRVDKAAKVIYDSAVPVAPEEPASQGEEKTEKKSDEE
ncbi:MAG TPA: trigger factor [Candidatus Onthomonas avicola]|nr:trigger factor [Candidatus Onthomonas avicola]